MGEKTYSNLLRGFSFKRATPTTAATRIKDVMMRTEVRTVCRVFQNLMDDDGTGLAAILS